MRGHFRAHGTQVELFYHDRQYYMRGYIGNKISMYGATRNLVIRNAKADMTRQSICDDLEHIHHLKVVDINVIRDEAYISLNSVQNAISARSCMQSRLKYKACRIEHYPDECDQPLPDVPQKVIKKFDPIKDKARSPGSNRFQVLASDNSDESDNIQEADDQAQQHSILTQAFTAFKMRARLRTT